MRRSRTPIHEVAQLALKALAAECPGSIGCCADHLQRQRVGGVPKERQIGASPGFGLPVPHATNDPMAWMTAGAEAWSKGLEAWSQMLGQYSQAGEQKDRRFASPEWRDNPIFDTVRQSYLAISDKLLGTVEEIEGIDEEARDRLRFATKGFVEAMGGTVWARARETVGAECGFRLRADVGDDFPSS